MSVGSKLEKIINEVIILRKYDDLYLTRVLLDTIIKSYKFYMPMPTHSHSHSYSHSHSHSHSKLYNTNINWITEDNGRAPCIVSVVNDDTFDVAIKYNIGGVLNLGNAYGTGGGAIYGQHAQEEDLCRRSTLLPELFEFNGQKISSMQWGQYIEYIPSPSVLYTQDVIIFKDNAKNNHALTSYIYKCNVITACAVRYSKPQSYSDRDRAIMMKTINNILYTAYITGNRTIVLGSLGCGAFNNNPEECASSFRECIHKYRFVFDRIVFAVLSTGNNNNYTIFRDKLQNI